MLTQTFNLLVRRPGLAVTFGALFLCGCVTPSVRPNHYPSTARDWHGIDSVEFLRDFHLDDYSRLLVEPFDTTSAKLPPREENTREPAVATLKWVDGIILTQLQRTVGRDLAVSSKDQGGASLERTLLLRGKVAEVDPGSWALRYWIGFGAGSASVRIKGEIVDGKTNGVLLRFDQRRVAAMSWYGGEYHAMLADCVAWIGRDIGRMLTLFNAP